MPESFSFSPPIAMAMSYAPDATAKQALRSASEPVAHRFSTRVTGGMSNFRGTDSVSPPTPDCRVPSQKASTSWMPTPADSEAPRADSINRSSIPRSNNSPNWVHAIPTMATRSRSPRRVWAVSHITTPPSARGPAGPVGRPVPLPSIGPRLS